MKLETLCREKLTHTNLVHHGKNLLCVHELYENTDLFELCVGTLTKDYVVTYDTSGIVENIGSILHSVVTSFGNFIELYHSVIQLVLKVPFSKFRRDVLSFLKKKRVRLFVKKL